MATPEEHLALAQKCLSRGDFPALFSTLQDLDRDLRRLTAPDLSTSVDPPRSRSYDSDQNTTSSDGSEATLRRRVDSLGHDVDEILAACCARQRETLDELTTLRSQRQFQEPVGPETGRWFKSQA